MAGEGKRPDPDEILKRIKAAEAAKGRPRFKVFFGMCAGVGKTYAMLQEAESARESGADIVLGLVETHGRPETEALLGDLERLPLRSIAHRGFVIHELDVDAVLDRKPDIVVVDELAHTNAPGSRHAKRWQDVFEILDHGISVWTAVNVQHIESLSDVVEDFSEVPVRERVPDSVLDRADEMRLIDIAPQDLIHRLELGRVYTGDASRAAIESFFKPRNLGALRELALRFSAGRAERDLSALARAEGGLSPGFAPGGTILVAVGPSPSSAFLVRWTRRTAYALRARWIAVHVDTGTAISQKDGERLEANLGLARKLGAETLLIQSSDVAEAIIETAKARSASMIVIGRSGLSRVGFLPHRPTVSDRIVREAGPVDVSVVQDSKVSALPFSIARLRRFFAAPARQYAFLALLCAAVTGIGFLVSGHLAYWGIALLYLLAMIAASCFVSLGPILVFSLASVFAFNFFFIPPLYSFSIGAPEDLLFFVVFLVSAVITGSLVARLRSNESLFRGRESQAAFLLEAAELLAESHSSEEAAAKAAELIEEHFETEAAVIAAEPDGGISGRAIGKAAPSFDDKDRAAAHYSFSDRAICGSGTDSLPESKFHYVPASAEGGASGVMALRLPPHRVWKRSDDSLLLSLGRILSLVIERENSTLKSHRQALDLESERLSTLLLDTMSHELRSPLTIIAGSITALKDDAVAADARARKGILEGAVEAVERLDLLVEEILSMNRIESGALRLDRVLIDLPDIAVAILREAKEAQEKRRVTVAIGEGSKPVFVDAALVAHLAANLLRNAAAYSRPGGPIELRLEESGDLFSITVRDSGPGIPSEEISLMFERFKRGRGAPPGGIGLGLPISKGIAEAHGGSIGAQNLPGGDFQIVATFPHSVKEG